MCQRCTKFEELNSRAEAIRAGSPLRFNDSIDQVSAELDDHFAQIDAEDGVSESDPRVAADHNIIRGKILRGEEVPRFETFTGSPQELIELIGQRFGKEEPQKEKPHVPTLDEQIDAANMAVENTLVRIDPAIRLAVELREKLKRADFSDAAAEQMAAAVFLAGFRS